MAGVSAIPPNLCCNSRLEREGIQNLIEFTGEANTILLKQCLKDVDSQETRRQLRHLFLFPYLLLGRNIAPRKNALAPVPVSSGGGLNHQGTCTPRVACHCYSKIRLYSSNQALLQNTLWMSEWAVEIKGEFWL